MFNTLELTFISEHPMVTHLQGRGKSTPTAYFYQNMGEAEYAVVVLIGYPPEKISILMTYNGQKDLLLDILSQRYMPPELLWLESLPEPCPPSINTKDSKMIMLSYPLSEPTPLVICATFDVLLWQSLEHALDSMSFVDRAYLETATSSGARWTSFVLDQQSCSL